MISRCGFLVRCGPLVSRTGQARAKGPRYRLRNGALNGARSVAFHS